MADKTKILTKRIYNSHKKKCSVVSCNNFQIDSDTINFYNFPRKEKFRLIWLKYCQNDALYKYSDNYIRKIKICEEHFDNTQFREMKLDGGNIKKKLIHNAVPGPPPIKLRTSIKTNLNCTDTSSKTCKESKIKLSTDTPNTSENGKKFIKESSRSADANTNKKSTNQISSLDRKDNDTSSPSSSIPFKKIKTEIDTPLSLNVDAPLQLFSSCFLKELIPPISPPPVEKEPLTMPNQLLQKIEECHNKVSIENQMNLKSNTMSVPLLKETKNTSNKIKKPKKNKIPTIPVSQQRNNTICDSIESKDDTKEQSSQSKLPSKKKKVTKSTKSLEERFKKRHNIIKSRDGSGTYYAIQNRKKKRTNKNDHVKRIFIDDVMEVLHDILPPFLRICLEYQLCKFRHRKPSYQYQMNKLSATLLAYMGKRAYEVLALMMPLQNVKHVRRNLKNPQFRPDIELFKMESNDTINLNLFSKTFDLRPEDSNYRYIKVDHSDEEISDEDIDEGEGEDETNEETEPIINWFSGDLEDDLDESEEEYHSDSEIIVEFNIPTENMSYNDIINTESNKYDVIDEKNFITIKQEDVIDTYIEESNETSIIYPESEIKTESYHKPKLKKDVCKAVYYSDDNIIPYIDFDVKESKTSKIKHKSSKLSRLNVKNR